MNSSLQNSGLHTWLKFHYLFFFFLGGGQENLMAGQPNPPKKGDPERNKGLLTVGFP